MSKLNCWEIKDCGRGPGGCKVPELGVCAAAADKRYDGVNGGVRAGRMCWVVAGTLCGGHAQGSFARKRVTCFTCEVYNRIQEEEGEDFILGQNLTRDDQSGLRRTIRSRRRSWPS